RRVVAALPVGHRADDLDRRRVERRRAVPVPRPPAGERMRVGFIGAGAIARSHLGILADLPDTTVAAVCDLNSAVAEETAAAAGGATAYGVPGTMLASEELDAVFVCTPPGAHLAAVSAALERG